MEKKLNPSEEELDKSLNPDEEDFEDEELEFLDEDEEDSEEEPEKDKSEDEEPKTALEILNAEFKKAGLNKNYKSWDDVIKSEKQRDTEFAQGKKPMEPVEKNEEEQEIVPAQPVSNMSERVLKLEHPESVHVLEEIKRDHPKGDVLAIYESSEYYKKEATVREENEQAKRRITSPSGGVEGDGGKPANDTESFFMNEDNLPPGFGFLPKKKK
jgi:hypothetical protein